MSNQNKAVRGNVLSPEGHRCLVTVHVWHADVQHGHVRLKLPRRLNSLAAATYGHCLEPTQLQQ
nr:hypothetical protein [Schlegelella koreensis]